MWSIIGNISFMFEAGAAVPPGLEKACGHATTKNEPL